MSEGAASDVRPPGGPGFLPSFVAQAWMPLAEAPAAGALPAGLRDVVSRRRREFLAGRVCASRALRRLGVRPRDREVAIGPGGAPRWPIGVIGSITHGDGLVWAAAARTRDAEALGIDVEPLIPHTRAERVAERIATPAELSRVVRSSGLTREAALTLVFSAKESLFKALYPQVGRTLDCLDARMLEVRAGRFRVRLTTCWSAAWPAGAVIEGRFRFRDDRVETALVCGHDRSWTRRGRSA